MRFTLTIECDNAAFDDDPGGEIKRIIIEAAERTELASALHGRPSVGKNGTLRDANGNTVGRFGFEGHSMDEISSCVICERRLPPVRNHVDTCSARCFQKQRRESAE